MGLVVPCHSAMLAIYREGLHACDDIGSQPVTLQIISFSVLHILSILYICVILVKESKKYVSKIYNEILMTIADMIMSCQVWVLVLAGAFLSIGVYVFGENVIRTVGEKLAYIDYNK